MKLMKRRGGQAGGRVALVFGLVVALLTACIPPAAAPAPTPAATAEAVEPVETAAVVPIEPQPAEKTSAPVSLTIEEIGLEAEVTPMTWTVAEVDGRRTTKWVVPDAQIGWQSTSADAGAAGNLILAGHQAVGGRVLAPLALGQIQPGQEVLIRGENGTGFIYTVVEVSEPIALTGATDAETAAAAVYVAPVDDRAVLTLITGWPDFTTTHRVFARAELTGTAP